MSFKPGDRVVYPHHGAAIIERAETKEAFGEQKEYLILRMAHGDLTLSVPADKAEQVGMRLPISTEDVEDLFELLAKKDVREPANWSRRFKNHQEKLKSGDVYQVAEVVRNLALREQSKGLSAGEKSMLQKALSRARVRAELRPRRLRGRGARAGQGPARLISSRQVSRGRRSRRQVSRLRRRSRRIPASHRSGSSALRRT